MSIASFTASEKLRYLLAGAVNTALGYLIFVAVYFLLTPYGVNYVIVVVLSQAIAITFAFFNYRIFVFRSASNPWLEYSRFVSVYLAAAVLNIGVMIVLVDWLGRTVLLSQALTMVIVVIVSYIGHRTFTFRSRNPR